MQAYNLAISMKHDHRAPGSSGWVFGLPPGIKPQEWPLDPNSGYPLKHGFTLLLPAEYRVHGPDTVALSFFSISPEHNDGVPLETPGLFDIIRSPQETPPEDTKLRPFWEQARTAHPRIHRMTDILECEYAVILLTQTEFNGALCPVPDIAGSEVLQSGPPRPKWLDEGSAHSFYKQFDKPDPMEKVRRAVGGSNPFPPLGLEIGLPIFVEVRSGDPNAGKKAVESWEEEGDYEQPFTEEFDHKPWAEEIYEHGNHLGGTMFPIQAVPDFSPYYIEFEESFGDYNFGGGNAQLDIQNLKFDWACG